MFPFGGIQPVCHDRHKTVPEFIVILCNQMWMTTTEVRLLMWSSLALFANQGRFDFGTFNFRQLFWKANTYCVYISDRANWRLLCEISKFHGQFTSRCRSTHDIWYPTRCSAANKNIAWARHKASVKTWNLMCVLNDVYISGRPRPTAIKCTIISDWNTSSFYSKHLL